jgi:hypothetical protein
VSEEPTPIPPPVKTIRVGSEMFEDIIDFMVLIRTKNKDGVEDVVTRCSSAQWGHGAMAQEIGFIEHMNNCWDGGEPE